MKCFFLAALLAAFLTVPAFAQMDMSNPPAMTAATIARSASGSKLTFVMRIDTMQRNVALGHILDPVSGNTYRATASTLSVHIANDLPVVMGSHDDLKAGAVVYVYGVATKANAADATKLVVVTPYVKTR